MQEVEESVIKIQSNYRGHVARRQFAYMKDEAMRNGMIDGSLDPNSNQMNGVVGYVNESEATISPLIKVRLVVMA